MLPFFARVFDLRRNQNTAEAIAADIAEGAEVAGPNLWVLFFAIVVASVGLNVNSTAVIIGAMLISPLMGPIVAIGYGVGVDNFALIRRAFTSLGLFTGIGLATSTLYFLLTPLSQAQSELLARTTPTVWDVLIACAGGGAGMIAATRQKPSNIVPGVAIATALMPPLCTAGYGLANGRLAYVSGALFLFSINAVFIALSTLLVVKALRLPSHHDVTDAQRRRARIVFGVAATLTFFPSIYLAWELVSREVFRDAAAREVQRLRADPSLLLLDSAIDPEDRTLTLTVGSTPPPSLATGLETLLSSTLRGQATVSVRAINFGALDLARLREQLQQERGDAEGDAPAFEAQRLRDAELEALAIRGDSTSRAELLRELRAEFPEATSVSVAFGEQRTDTDSLDTKTVNVHLVAPDVRRAREWNTGQRRLRDRLVARYPQARIDLVISPP
jgi:uncharacterized hydrophobic protein (TIGR00271 family)